MLAQRVRMAWGNTRTFLTESETKFGLAKREKLSYCCPFPIILAAHLLISPKREKRYAFRFDLLKEKSYTSHAVRCWVHATKGGFWWFHSAGKRSLSTASIPHNPSVRLHSSSAALIRAPGRQTAFKQIPLSSHQSSVAMDDNSDDWVHPPLLIYQTADWLSKRSSTVMPCPLTKQRTACAAAVNFLQFICHSASKQSQPSLNSTRQRRLSDLSCEGPAIAGSTVFDPPLQFISHFFWKLELILSKLLPWCWCLI